MISPAVCSLLRIVLLVAFCVPPTPYFRIDFSSFVKNTVGNLMCTESHHENNTSKQPKTNANKDLGNEVLFTAGGSIK